jgi:hypothetical protein
MGLEELATTRRSLHAAAELVLAGPQYRATGKLRLRIVPGGFATVLQPELRVIGTRVVDAGGTGVPIDGHTARAIGAELGVRAARPEGAYADGAGVGLDETLTLDSGHADLILQAHTRGHDALIAFAPGEAPVLWPEHFDVAIGLPDATFGVSPGDGFIAEPYAYASVDRLPAGDSFWNAPFGAAVRLSELSDTAAVTAFFAEARSRCQ